MQLCLYRLYRGFDWLAENIFCPLMSMSIVSSKIDKKVVDESSHKPNIYFKSFDATYIVIHKTVSDNFVFAHISETRVVHLTRLYL